LKARGQNRALSFERVGSKGVFAISAVKLSKMSHYAQKIIGKLYVRNPANMHIMWMDAKKYNIFPS
jgi:hypothetical protein